MNLLETFFSTYMSPQAYFIPSSSSCKQFFIFLSVLFICAKYYHCFFKLFFEEPTQYYYSHCIFCRYTLHSPFFNFWQRLTEEKGHTIGNSKRKSRAFLRFHSSEVLTSLMMFLQSIILLPSAL